MKRAAAYILLLISLVFACSDDAVKPEPPEGEDPSAGTVAPDGERIIMSPAPIISISSTYLRSALASGDSARYLLPDEAAGYIRENGLYGFSTS